MKLKLIAAALAFLAVGSAQAPFYVIHTTDPEQGLRAHTYIRPS